MRYKVEKFSPSQFGAYDTVGKDFVKNPQSNRRRLFHKESKAQELVDTLNSAGKEMDKATFEDRLIDVASNYSRQIAYLREAIDELIEEREALKEQLRQSYIVIQALNEQLALRS